MRFVTIIFAMLTCSLSAAADYAEARRQAEKDGKSVVLFVGCKEIHGIPAVHVAHVKSVEGYPAQCVIVSQPGGKLWAATLPSTATVEDIKRAINPPADDALATLNAQRAQRGLPPYLRDEGLTQGAVACAKYRAANGIAGHSSNDFQFLPQGASSSTAGCACWGPSWGFGACEAYGNYTYAGAATVIGADGQAYHQLFVR